MEKELLKVIKDNLPETVAGEMKEFILQAEQTKKDLKRSEKKVEGLEEQLNERALKIKRDEEKLSVLNVSIADLNNQINICENCNERFLQLRYKEQIMDIKNRHSIERVNDAKELVSLVFKSPVFRKQSLVSTSRTKDVPYQDNSNGYQSTMYNTESENSTVSTSESIVEEGESGETSYVYSSDQAKDWFLSNSSGLLTCAYGDREKICSSYPEAEEFFNK